MSQQDEQIAASLAFTNVALMAYGHEPLSDLPTARIGDSRNCLFARALRPIGVESVGGSGDMRFHSERVAAAVAELWGVEHDGSVVRAPVQFANVIGSFDGGVFPHYSEKATG